MEPRSDSLFTIQINKEEIVRGDTNRAKSILRSLTQQLGKRSYQAVVMLVDGYNDIPDELFQIPEVRKWTQKLFREVPHVLYFINRKLEAHHWLLLSIGDVTTILDAPNKTLEQLVSEGRYWENRPKWLSSITLPSKQLKMLVRETKSFALKLDDPEGAREVGIWINSIFNS